MSTPEHIIAIGAVLFMLALVGAGYLAAEVRLGREYQERIAGFQADADAAWAEVRRLEAGLEDARRALDAVCPAETTGLAVRFRQYADDHNDVIFN